MKLSPKNQIKKKSFKLLAIREHSEYELRVKLKKSFQDDLNLIDEVIEELKAKDFLSDFRYAEAVLKNKQKKYGPLYIKSYLKQKKVGQDLIDSIFNVPQEYWQDNIEHLIKKKYSITQDVTKIKRHLYQKGFNYEQISSSLKKMNIK